jgi:hypothetical protein
VEVLVHSHAAGSTPDLLARAVTNEAGVAGFATPADVDAAHIVLSVRHADFNPRHLRLDGVSLSVDLRRELYGAG